MDNNTFSQQAQPPLGGSEPYKDNRNLVRTASSTRSPFGNYLIGLRRDYVWPESEMGSYQSNANVSDKMGVITAKKTGSFENSGKGISGCALSTALGMGKYVITQYENGYCHPSANCAKRIAAFFGVPEEEVIDVIAHSKSTWGLRKKGIRALDTSEEAEALASQFSHVIRSNVSYKDIKWLHNKAVQSGKSISRTLASVVSRARLHEEEEIRAAKSAKDFNDRNARLTVGLASIGKK